MTRKASTFTKSIFLLVFGLMFLAACKESDPTEPPAALNPTESATPEAVKPATATPLTYPTLDPSIPLAASVNGQGIPLAAYQAELARAQAASATGLAAYTEADVLQNLIDELLLAQGAADAGFIPDETLIQTRLAQLGLEEQALQDWQTTHGYTPESFEIAFARSLAAAWMRDQIVAAVSSTAEQVHARQILLYNADEAETAYAQLQAGTDFATLAAQYDPLAAGQLGWFPRSYLTVPELDDPIFSRQPGEYTPIIETALGFHIVQVIERNPQRPLSSGARQTLQIQAVENWLIERRSQSNIQILLS